MTEQEAIQLHISENIHRIEVIEDFLSTNSDANDKECRKNIDILTKTNKALEEVQQYRAIGTVEELKESKEQYDNINCAAKSIQLSGLCDFENAKGKIISEIKRNYECSLRDYEAIGTPEECRAAVEKQTAKKPIRNDKCTCPSCGTHNEVIKKRRNTVYSDIVYCWHCGQAVKIFRSDEE